jgi:capsular polysaccharide export protein
MTAHHAPSSTGPQADWPAAFRALVAKRHTLMLQGPMGTFFSELASVLMAHGQSVTKVHFNGGDQVFWRHTGALRYNGRPQDLGDWLRQLMHERQIDTLVIFGQMRPIHRVARDIARALGVEVFVFEEGYLRPDYVTIERRGVNALSRQPRVASFYQQRPMVRPRPPQPTGQNIWRMSLIATLYSWATTLLKPWYWRQTYHRRINPVGEALRWVRGATRQRVYAWAERGALEQLCAPTQSKRWFLLPLQVRGDSQVKDHSRFKGMEDMLDEVVASFARHAPADTLLVVKHHPMDRAYTNYSQHIRALARLHGLEQRLLYLHDQHLPTLLNHARGVVTVNSTVGLQALYHGTPVITLGDSVYQIPGLVYGGHLEAFWAEPGTVDRALYARFRAHLIASTQLNASFYAQRPALQAENTRAQAPIPPDPHPSLWDPA